MADLLSGDGGKYSTFSPLSHSQTVAMGQHLQDQISALRSKVEELDHNFNHQNDHGVGSLQSRLQETEGRVQKLIDDLAHQNNKVDCGCRGLDRANSAISELQQGAQQANEDISGLRGHRNIANGKMDKLCKDIVQTNNFVLDLKDIIEKRVSADVEELRQELARADLVSTQLRKDQECVATDLDKEREKLKLLTANGSETRHDLHKTNTVVHIIEQRLMHVANSLKVARGSIDLLQGAVHEHTQDHGHTKLHVQELQTGAKDIHVKSGQVREDVDRVGQALKQMQGKLGKAWAALEGVTTNHDHMRQQVHGLEEGQAQANVCATSFKDELTELSSLVQFLRKELSQTNALVLPNLQIDASVGSSAHQNCARRPTSRRSNNIDMNGSSKNRVAWI
mmetsp:Transcript_49293/g.130617  ORF Transcript_49293/g.130617 Transcript_49293/m.130617 type:complete len:395 (-) Transcript_49293:504-1688(-)